MLAWIIVFSLLGSVGALLGAALLLFFPEHTRQQLLPWLLSYATGTLLGAAFLDMLPTALRQADTEAICLTVLIGVLLFFVLEQQLLWRHSHDYETEDASSESGTLILVGDAFHNFVDGILIAGAFLSSIPLGVATSLAIIAHEIPQEVGDFAILLNSGYRARRALILNGLSSLTTLPGALLGFLALTASLRLLPYVLALSAASFIYIAMADLIPQLKGQVRAKASIFYLVLVLLGIGTIAIFSL